MNAYSNTFIVLCPSSLIPGCTRTLHFPVKQQHIEAIDFCTSVKGCNCIEILHKNDTVNGHVRFISLYFTASVTRKGIYIFMLHTVSNYSYSHASHDPLRGFKSKIQLIECCHWLEYWPQKYFQSLYSTHRNSKQTPPSTYHN